LKADAAKLKDITQDFSAHPPSDKWSKNDQLAFWLNAYNAFTLKLIVDNYPVSSITKLDGGKPWDVKRIKIGEAVYSLNQIENEIIRSQFKDARIHFALNCAAKSCPPLSNKAFLAEALDKQLDQQTRAFVRSQSNELSATSIKVSKIFDWYKDDFKDLPAFLNKYGTVKIGANAQVGFAEYNWDLNE